MIAKWNKKDIARNNKSCSYHDPEISHCIGSLLENNFMFKAIKKLAPEKTYLIDTFLLKTKYANAMLDTNWIDPKAARSDWTKVTKQPVR